LDNADLDKIVEKLSFDMKSTTDESKDDDSVSASSSMISLSMDDVYQYNMPQPAVTDAISVPDGMDIQEKLNEGAAKVVPLGMDEFMTSEGNSSMMISRQTRIMAGSEIKTGADVSDFPDLLDSGNSLASLNPTYSFDDQSTNDPSLDRFLKSTSLKTESDGGLVFTNLNEMNNVYPEVDESNLNPPVVAKKSVVQLTDVKSEVEFQVKNEHTASLDQTECVYVKSEVKDEPAADSKLNSQQFQTTLTFYNAACACCCRYYPFASTYTKFYSCC